jgi:hypothetical protein
MNDSNHNTPELSGWAAWLDARMERIFARLEKPYRSLKHTQY